MKCASGDDGDTCPKIPYLPKMVRKQQNYDYLSEKPHLTLVYP